MLLRNGALAWIAKRNVCLKPAQKPVTTADVGVEVRRVVTTYLPVARPSFQPAAGGIVNLPTIFASGEPQTLRTEPFDVLGFTVVVSARARWVWTFDPGVVEPFAGPGGSYPDMSSAHTYPSPGERSVSVTTFWRGTFTVDGRGPFPAPGPEPTRPRDRWWSRSARRTPNWWPNPAADHVGIIMSGAGVVNVAKERGCGKA